MSQPCRHQKRQTIARDDATTYVECLECGQFFETAELDAEPPEPSEFEESLSDA